MSDSKQAAMAFWRALFSRDPARIRAVLCDDVEWIAPLGNATAIALGVTHHMVGPDAIIDFVLDDFRRLFPDGLAVEPISITADANIVVFEQRQRAVLANGRDFDLVYVFILEMAGEKVRRIREYMDTHVGHAMVFGGEPSRRIV